MDETCINCYEVVDFLEVFPGPRCMRCHELVTYRGFNADDIRYALNAAKVKI